MAALDPELAVALASLAPGTRLRDGLERILRGRTGALIVLGVPADPIATGGFPLDIEFSATGLRELAKMDGAIVIDTSRWRVVQAAAQLVPDASIPTSETGTRHRTADRVSRQTGLPIISVSKSMNIIALYLRGRRHVVEEPSAVLSRANQALATLERYTQRLNEVARTLSALEVEDIVTLRDVALTVQRLEMVRHIASEIRAYLLELGTEGRLVALQLAELVAGVDVDRELVVRDYLPPRGQTRRTRSVAGCLEALDLISPTDLLDLTSIARALGYPATAEGLEQPLTPRGHRMLSQVPRLPELLRDRLVEHHGSLQPLLRATVDELQQVDGVGANRARYIRDGLSKLAESSIVERYA